MLTQLIVGGDLSSRLQAVATYRQSFQVVLDGTDQSLKIEAVRQLQHALSLTSTTNQTQYHLILEAQNLTLPAQQALLKTLEEPPANTQIILTADKKNSLLPTILSRVSLLILKDAIPSSAADSDSLNSFLRLLPSLQVTPLIKLAQTIAKDNPSAFLTSLQDRLRLSLPTQPTLNRAKAIALTQTALNDLKTNITKDLLLSHLFLNLQQLAQPSKNP